MSEPNPGAEPPAVPPAAPAPPAPVVAKVELTSEQLTQRLTESGASASKRLLKSLGFESEDAAKAALGKLKDLETASLTEKEKLERQIADLTPKVQRGDAAHARLSALVDAQFKALPEAVQAAIDATAKGDPDKRLDAMAIVAAAQGAAPPASAPPKPAPVNLTPSPAPAPATGVRTKFDEWQEHQKTSPMLGDLFYNQHQRAIELSRPAS